MKAVGVGPDHCNGFKFVEVERKQVLVVLQKNDSFLCRLQRHRPVPGAVGGLLRVIWVNKRIIEQSQPELYGQHASNCLPEFTFCNHSWLNSINQCPLYRSGSPFQVTTA